jgi:hypothetical protein
MSMEITVAVVAGVTGVVSSVITSAVIVGKYLGQLMTTQAQHVIDHERHYQSARDQGIRFERLGEGIAELRGEIRGRVGGDFSSGHRITPP